MLIPPAHRSQVIVSIVSRQFSIRSSKMYVTERAVEVAFLRVYAQALREGCNRFVLFAGVDVRIAQVEKEPRKIRLERNRLPV